jgi:hypothetical protein
MIELLVNAGVTRVGRQRSTIRQLVESVCALANLERRSDRGGGHVARQLHKKSPIVGRGQEAARARGRTGRWRSIGGKSSGLFEAHVVLDRLDAADVARHGAVLQAPHQEQDDHDYQHDTDDSTGAVTPAARVRPRGQDADEHQDHDY